MVRSAAVNRAGLFMSEARHTQSLVWVCISILGLWAMATQVVSVKPDRASLPMARIQFVGAGLVKADPGLPAPYKPLTFKPTSQPDSDLFVDALVQVESRGDPTCVGKAGERGLMQIKEATWRDTTDAIFTDPVSFDRAFDAGLNRKVGIAYLIYLRGFLLERRDHWDGDLRNLLAASYNAGPGAVEEAGFDIGRLRESTQDYVDRVITLHDFYRSEQAAREVFLADAGRR